MAEGANIQGTQHHERDSSKRDDRPLSFANVSTENDSTAEEIASIAPQESDLTQSQDGQVTPYSVFTRSQKWTIVLLATFASIFSPLASSIYFPAIPSLSSAFHKSTQDIKSVLLCHKL